MQLELQTPNTSGGFPVETARLKVVVAEDSGFQRLYLCSMVEALGYEAIPAGDGREALDLILKTGAQIVISDIQMPDLDGIAMTRTVRSMDMPHYVHIIVVTGSDETEIRAEALDAGADDFLIKGGSTSMLEARLRTASRLVQHASELARRAQELQEYKDRIQEDLHAAASAQKDLLPQHHEDFYGFSIASAFVPSAIVSGDMFGCFPISKHELGFYAVDVSGHGVHASLLSVAIGHLITPAYFRTRVIDSTGIADPAALVASLNARFSASEKDDYFTMFCGVIDRTTGQLDFCQAGYPSPFYICPRGEVSSIGDGGLPVGMFHEAEFENNVAQIGEGGALVICSDAAIEAATASGQPFGDARLRDLLGQMPDIGPRAMPNHIVTALNAWRGGAPLEDDLTVVTLGRKVNQ
ncbi:sigma-B regulation protein RsbU (phosphoserine phosphatase) [Rubricella aquisinus]|uniref:Sigma-B regulation protein RsbU (Phosphoserine phosphatase) n=1 Tax=Rubricella aquisinus TaxID=2028108 RepID=A0A840X0Z5_9RHOB|nr:sigma-B regulation protein RsbU (phosphoserine phosphatase) [Rubricella aquisinus]